MTGILLSIVGVIYLGVSVKYLVDGHTGMAIAFASYAIANYGFYLAGKS